MCAGNLGAIHSKKNTKAWSPEARAVIGKSAPKSTKDLALPEWTAMQPKIGTRLGKPVYTSRESIR